MEIGQPCHAGWKATSSIRRPYRSWVVSTGAHAARPPAVTRTTRRHHAAVGPTPVSTTTASPASSLAARSTSAVIE